MTIGEQVAECLLFRRKASRQEAFERAKELLTQVGIDNAEKRLKNYSLSKKFAAGIFFWQRDVASS